MSLASLRGAAFGALHSPTLLTTCAASLSCAASPSCAASLSRSDHASTDWPEHLAIAREAILDTLAAHGALVLRGALRKKQPEQTDAERLEQVLRPADALLLPTMLCVRVLRL